MANNSLNTEVVSYLRFCDTAGNKTKTGSNNYTDLVIPTNTILAIGGDAGAAAIKIVFQSVKGDSTDDSVDMTYDITRFGLPHVINEIVQAIQKPGGGVTTVCDANTGVVCTPALTGACTINVQD